MAKRQRIARTEQERAERRRQEQELTERAVAQLRSSAGWQRWLMVRARVGRRRLSLIILSRDVVDAAVTRRFLSATCRRPGRRGVDVVAEVRRAGASGARVDAASVGDAMLMRRPGQ